MTTMSANPPSGAPSPIRRWGTTPYRRRRYCSTATWARRSSTRPLSSSTTLMPVSYARWRTGRGGLRRAVRHRVVPENRILLSAPTASTTSRCGWARSASARRRPAVGVRSLQGADLPLFHPRHAARAALIDASSWAARRIAAALTGVAGDGIVRGEAGLAPELAGKKVRGRRDRRFRRARRRRLSRPSQRRDLHVLFRRDHRPPQAITISPMIRADPRPPGPLLGVSRERRGVRDLQEIFHHGLWPGLLIPLYWGATASWSAGRRCPTRIGDHGQGQGDELVSVPTSSRT